MFEGTRGSPNAPTRIASKSRASIANPSGGTVVLSARYRSAPQSKWVKAKSAPIASRTRNACGMTSLPTPSPGMTAIRFLALTRTKISESDTDGLQARLIRGLSHFLSALLILRYNRSNTREHCLTTRFKAKPTPRFWQCSRGVPGACLGFRGVRPQQARQDQTYGRRPRALAQRNDFQQRSRSAEGQRRIRISTERSGTHSGRPVCLQSRRFIVGRHGARTTGQNLG